MKHLAAVVPSGWQGPVINELSQPRSLGRARGHTSVCHSGLTPSPSPAASRSPRDFPDVPRFSVRGAEATVAESQSWHCVCDTGVCWITLLQSSECIKALCIMKWFFLLLFQMLIWFACVCDEGSWLCVVGFLGLVAYRVEKDVISAFFPCTASLSTSSWTRVQNRTCGYQVSIAYDKSSASKADILLPSPKGG